jgi:AraC-like DNA-binding protein
MPLRTGCPLDVSLLRAIAAGLFRVSEVARYVGVSPRQLRRIFARHVGCSPEGWLREARLQAALRMLPGAVSVKQVAYDLEFRHLTQFCRDFRARFGSTPSDHMQRRSFRSRARPAAPGSALQRKMIGGATGGWSSGTMQPEMSKSM